MKKRLITALVIVSTLSMIASEQKQQATAARVVRATLSTPLAGVPLYTCDSSKLPKGQSCTQSRRTAEIEQLLGTKLAEATALVPVVIKPKDKDKAIAALAQKVVFLPYDKNWASGAKTSCTVQDGKERVTFELTCDKKFSARLRDNLRLLMMNPVGCRNPHKKYKVTSSDLIGMHDLFGAYGLETGILKLDKKHHKDGVLDEDASGCYVTHGPNGFFAQHGTEMLQEPKGCCC